MTPGGWCVGVLLISVLALAARRLRMDLHAHRIECDNAARLLRPGMVAVADREFAEQRYKDAVMRYNRARASLPGKLISRFYRFPPLALLGDPAAGRSDGPAGAEA